MTRPRTIIAAGRRPARDNRPYCPDPECSGRIEFEHEHRDRATGAYHAEGRCSVCGGGYYEGDDDQ